VTFSLPRSKARKQSEANNLKQQDDAANARITLSRGGNLISGLNEKKGRIRFKIN
jgi:hypothetical protein